jgi:hypothetical protein
METLINIFFLFMDFLTWLLHQGTWGVIASLVIILTLISLNAYIVIKVFMLDNPNISYPNVRDKLFRPFKRP